MARPAGLALPFVLAVVTACTNDTPPPVAYYVKAVLSLSGRAQLGAMTTTTELVASPHE